MAELNISPKAQEKEKIKKILSKPRFLSSLLLRRGSRILMNIQLIVSSNNKFHLQIYEEKQTCPMCRFSHKIVVFHMTLGVDGIWILKRPDIPRQREKPRAILSTLFANLHWKGEHITDLLSGSAKFLTKKKKKKPCSAWATFRFKEEQWMGMMVFLIFISNNPQVKTLSCHPFSRKQRGKGWYLSSVRLTHQDC